MKTTKKETNKDKYHETIECVTEEVANINSFGLCKAPNVSYCKYMVKYGYSNYCSHPNWKSFIKKEDNNK